MYPEQPQFHYLLSITILMLHTLVKMGIVIQQEILLEAVKLMVH